ncbi:MAG: glycosyltransferase family 2 protein [Planctomycetes bacterium]|nr:glycosyltransferase family 2 protein [Planctomycetota bacterium]
MRERLTVIIPCKNERMNIRPCVESVRHLADEVLIADSGSQDGTMEIARSIGPCRIIEREYVHSGDFKNWAIPQATHPWVLIVDADERVAPELAGEIRRILECGGPLDGYWIRRENYFQGHRIRFSGWQSDRCLRLFRRDLGRYVGDNDHAEVRVSSGRVGVLCARLRHFTAWSARHYLRKLDRYASYQAEVWYRAGRKPRPVKLALIAPFRFAQTYFLRLGFLDGVPGLQICALTAFYSFLKQALLWEHHRAARQPDPEAQAATPRKTSAA